MREKDGFMSSMLLQKHGSSCGLFYTKWDSVAAGLPYCLKSVAAASVAVLAS